MKQLSVKGDKVIGELLEMRKFAEEGNIATFQRMSKCDRMHIGDQWNHEVRDYLENKGKFAVTLNQILPTIEQLCGEEVQNPQDISVLPQKGSTATRARLISSLIKHSLDDQMYSRYRSQSFKDGVITGRGYIGMDRSFMNGDPVNGNLSINSWSPFMVLPDPASKKYDYNAIGGLRFIWTDDWIDKDIIHGWFPGRRQEIEGARYDITGTWTDYLFNMVTSAVFGGEEPYFDISDDYRDSSLYNDVSEWKFRYNYRVSTCWVRRWKKGAYIIYPRTGETKVIYKQSDIQREAARVQETGEPVRIVKNDGHGRPVVVPVLTKYTVVGNVVLEGVEDPFDGVHDIPVSRFAPYFRNGYEFGVVQNLIGPQEVKNWKVRGGTPDRKEWLESNGDIDGVVIDESEFGGNVEKLEMNQYDVGGDLITEKSEEQISRIANVRREDPTFDKRNISGVALSLKMQQAQTGSSFVIMHHSWTAEMFGRMVVELIIHSSMYSNIEIQGIVEQDDLVDPILLEKARQIIMISARIDEVEMPEPPDELTQIQLDPLNQGQYGIKVALSQAALTYRHTKRLEMLDLNKDLVESGQEPIPREVKIKASDSPYKEEILAGTAR
jgi:hypothetical protein